MEMFFLSYVNETMYLLWNLPFFKMVPPKTNFWLIIAQQTSIHIDYFTPGGWHTLCRPISKMHIVGEGPGETPSALRCLSYLINNFLSWEGLRAGGEGTTEDEMTGWHHWLDGRESEWTPGVVDGQGGLVCCDSWGHKSRSRLSDWTELNWTVSWSFTLI